jgi:hypothetical protein
MKTPIATLLLAVALAGNADAQQRDQQFYYPGSFNWQFLKRYPEAARLFNAFDYGHAILYETLYAEPERAVERLEERELRFIVGDLLVHPPRFAIAEEAVQPRYSRIAARARLMFDWAHLLHRQIYDVYADPRIPAAEKSALVERLTDYYLSFRAAAFTDRPKAMELMEGQEYSQTFRRRFPKFNALIWAYHWLQVGLYEAFLEPPSGADYRAEVDATVARFRRMLDSLPSTAPLIMPMTSAVAPNFAARHPRAAIIFDNLHMMHDIISDILASSTIPRDEKARAIATALDRFQDGEHDVMEMEHWKMMGEMMGGVEKMGGQAGRPRSEKPPGSGPHAGLTSLRIHAR